MKVAIFGDVHGNLIALETFLDFAMPRVDSFICTGDLVNYGPWSEECVLVTKSLDNLLCVRGNHEDLFQSSDTRKVSPLVAEFTDFSLPGFSQYDWISSLPLEEQFNDFTISHTLESRYIYANTDIQIDSSRIIGHSHQQFMRHQNACLLINPGSVGQNREFIDLVQFAIYESDTSTIQFFSLQHDIDAVIAEMKTRKYSARCINYYQSKPRIG
jgi:putative phosphoesterase